MLTLLLSVWEQILRNIRATIAARQRVPMETILISNQLCLRQRHRIASQIDLLLDSALSVLTVKRRMRYQAYSVISKILNLQLVPVAEYQYHQLLVV